MKLFLVFLVSLWSLAALGGMQPLHNNQYFNGSGVKFHPDGSTERYLVSLSISKKSAHKFRLNFDYQFAGKNMFFDLVHKHNMADSSFFSIYKEGELVGHGYCWGMRCHTNWSYHGYNIESSYYRHRRSGAIHSMGSKSKDGMVYIWKEKLRPLH